MTPARGPREEPQEERLLILDPLAGRWQDARVRDLPAYLGPGDLLVVNDAATVPASLFATTRSGARVELRLAAHAGATGDGGSAGEGASAGDGCWRAVLFGEGDWRTRTEHRAAPPPIGAGERLFIGPELDCVVESVAAGSPRLLVVRFSLRGADLWVALYRHGHPVQYAHVARPLELWDVQTPFASRPWALEMPSAGRPLAWALVARLRARGVRLAWLTHAAGLSSTGDPGLDASLPLPERFDLPGATVEAVAAARAEGRRVVAAGTSVVRALEGCAAMHEGRLAAGEGTTDLRIDARFRPRVVDGLLTGWHEAGTSHRELLQAFAPEPLLAAAWTHAERRGYLDHEFGDACLVLPSALAARSRLQPSRSAVNA